jgi:CRP-like cAMP-binding protein
MGIDASPIVEQFFSAYRLRAYSKGQILLLQGDEADDVYYLISGRVKQYDVTYRGDEVILNTFQPPAFFPMSLAMNAVPNLYTYEAETDVELRQAPAHEVVAFLKQEPEVTYDLLSRVYQGVDGILARMTHLMASSAKARLMFEIRIAYQRFGNKLNDDGVTTHINETELAARAGLSRETVSREMSKLVQEGVVEHYSGDVIIPSVKAFEEKFSKVF